MTLIPRNQRTSLRKRSNSQNSMDAETSDRFIVTFLEYVDGVGGGNNKSGWIYKEDYYNGSLNFHLVAKNSGKGIR